MSSESVVIRGGLVLTMNPARDVLSADVRIVDGRIAAIDQGNGRADTVVDAADCLVVPGFVQAHVHLGQTLFRGLADDMDVIDWLRTRIWPLEQAHDAESVYDSARLAIAEMIRSGTTAALTMETVHHTEAAFAAVLDTGFRATGGKAMMDRWEPGTEMVGESTSEAIAESVQLMDSFHGEGEGRLRYAFCPRGSRNATPELWRAVAALAEERGVILHTHAAENEAQTRRLASDGGTDVDYLHDLGVTGPRLVLAHCVWVAPSEIEVLAATGSHVAHCPSANMKLASGFAPVPVFLGRGINVGLGADGAPANNNLDMFLEMRLASLIHKPKYGADAMTAHQVFEMATLGGARALGLGNEIGSLEIGKKADVVVIRRGGLHLQPNEDVDPVAQIVYEHRASDVDSVLIDGKVVVRGGQLSNLEEAEIVARATASVRRVVAKAGL